MKFFRLSNHSLVFATVFSLALPLAHASSGGSSGGGGDVNCQEFYSIAVKESLALTKIGQANIDVVDPLIKADQVHDIVENLRVIPGKDLNRQAWSTKDPNSTPIYTTQLDVKAWHKLNNKDRYTLVSHELTVLAEIEFDGTYAVSGDLLRVVLNSKYSLDLKSDGYVINIDGTYTIQHPQFEGRDIDGEPKSLDGIGVCIYLGFKNLVGVPLTDDLYPGRCNVTIIDHNGRFVGFKCVDGYDTHTAISQIICSD